jgi:hypothetical protein
MAGEIWESPEANSGAGRSTPAAFELRPLTLGEILDRTFTVYRSRFWLFAGLATIAAALQSIVASIQLFFMHTPKVGPRPIAGTPPLPFNSSMSPAAIVGLVVAALFVWLLFFIAMSVTQAATAYALSEVYLGRSVTVQESLKATIGKWYRYIGITLWQGWSMMWIPLLCMIPAFALFLTKNTSLAVLGGVLLFLGFAGGLVGGFILYLRNTLAVPATAIEGLSVRASMRRSKVLSAGAKGRIFMVMLISGVLKYVVGLLQMPFLMVVMFSAVKGQEATWAKIVSMLVTFIGYSVAEPVLMIGLTLVYFDQRVRKEAFDLVMLLGPDQIAPPPEFAFTTPVDSPAIAASVPVAAPASVEDASLTGESPVV